MGSLVVCIAHGVELCTVYMLEFGETGDKRHDAARMYDRCDTSWTRPRAWDGDGWWRNVYSVFILVRGHVSGMAKRGCNYLTRPHLGIGRGSEKVKISITIPLKCLTVTKRKWSVGR